MINSITVTYNPEVSILSNQINILVDQVEKIIIIDNNSKNINEIGELTDKFLNLGVSIELIKLQENIGLAKAQNIGIKLAQKNLNCKYVLLFDQDSVPPLDFVNNLYTESIKLEEKGVNVAAVGPFYMDPKTNEIYPATLYVGPFIQRKLPENKPLEVTFIIASGSLISLKNINEIGLMNEDFFIDYIDVEWSLRAKFKGYKCFMLPNVIMYHSIGDKRMNLFGRSISIHTPLRRYYLIRNSFIISRLRYIPIGYKIREFFLNFIRFFIFLIVSDDKKNVWNYSVKGLVDGVVGRKGKKNFN